MCAWVPCLRNRDCKGMQTREREQMSHNGCLQMFVALHISHSKTHTVELVTEALQTLVFFFASRERAEAFGEYFKFENTVKITTEKKPKAPLRGALSKRSRSLRERKRERHECVAQAKRGRKKK